MASKTPQTTNCTMKEYLQSVSTENELLRTSQRRSVVKGPESYSGTKMAPDSSTASRRREKKGMLLATRSSPRARPRTSITGEEEQDVTPRHLIQNMLTVQGTGQPITRRKTRVSDVAMHPPVLSSVRKVARRSSSSVSGLDLDVVDRTTPRTNVLGFLEQAPEETPAVRKARATVDSHSTTQNVSNFTLNEVGVSLLEGSRDPGVNVSSSGGRFRGRKKNMNIQLPEVTRQSQSQQLSISVDQPVDVSHKISRTTVTTTTPDVAVSSSSQVSPTSTAQLTADEDAQNTENSHRNTQRTTDTLETSEVSEGEISSRNSERNVFSDVFGDSQDVVAGDQNQDVPEAERSRRSSRTMPEREMERTQGGNKSQTPWSVSATAAESFDKTSSQHLPHSRRRTNSVSGPETSDSVWASGETSRNEITSTKRTANESHDNTRILKQSKRSVESVVDASPVSGSAIKQGRRSGTPRMQDSSSRDESSKEMQQTSNLSVSSAQKRKGDSAKRADKSAALNQNRTHHTAVSSSVSRSPALRSSTRQRQKRLSQISLQTASAEEDGLQGSQFLEISRWKAQATSTPRLSSQLPQNTPTARTSSGRKSLSVVAGRDGQAPVISELETVSGRRSSVKGQTSTRKSQELLESFAGKGSSQKRARSSAVSRLSSRFENLEAEVDDPPVLQAENDQTTSVFAETATVARDLEMPDLTHEDSDQDWNSDDDDYSPLKTPRLPFKQRTPTTIPPRSATRNKNSGRSEMALQAGNKRKAAVTSRTGKKSCPGLPPSVVKATFSHFCQLRVSKEALQEVEKLSDQYWRNMAEDLEAYATHAHRQTINESDVELLMRRQGFITDTCSLNSLVAKYLPLELRQELIPIARSGNKVEPKV